MTPRDEHDVRCVLCEPFFETHNTNTDQCNCSNGFKKTYTKYTNYTPWPLTRLFSSEPAILTQGGKDWIKTKEYL